MKRMRVIQLGLLVLAALVASAVVAALAFGGSTDGRGKGPPVTTSGQLEINGTTIEVSSFSAGVSNPTTIGGGGGIGAGKASFSSLSLMTAVDASFPVLTQAVAKGQQFPTATLTFTWTAGDSAPSTVTYQLENVFIESIQQGGGGGAPTDAMSLAFAKVHWTFTDANGTTTRGWNILTNQPLP